MAKVGRPKAIKDPETLWQLFCGYRKETKDNPRIKYEHTQSGKLIPKPLEVPLTVEGFASYVCRNCEGINFPDIDRYLHNNRPQPNEGDYSEFITVAKTILNEIRRDQIEGGTVGVYNQQLVAKMNHLIDRQEITQTNNVKILNIDPLAPLPGEEDPKKIE